MPAKGFSEEHLDVTQIALGKAGLTVTKVIFPHANEGLRQAQIAHFVYIGKELLSPPS